MNPNKLLFLIPLLGAICFFIISYRMREREMYKELVSVCNIIGGTLFVFAILLIKLTL